MSSMEGTYFSGTNGSASTSSEGGSTSSSESTQRTYTTAPAYDPMLSTATDPVVELTDITITCDAEDENENKDKEDRNNNNNIGKEEDQVRNSGDDPDTATANSGGCGKHIVIQTMPRGSVGICVRNAVKHAAHKEHKEVLSLPQCIELYSSKNNNVKMHIQRIVYPNFVTSAMMRKMFPKDMERCKGKTNCPHCRGEEPKLVQGEFLF